MGYEMGATEIRMRYGMSREEIFKLMNFMSTEKLNIIAGNYYRRRDGVKQRVDVVWPEDSGLQQCARSMVKGAQLSWFMDGSYHSSAESPMDLLSPWTDPEPPKWRAWKPEEVPLGAQIRNKLCKDTYRALILSVDDKGNVTMAFNGQYQNLAIEEPSRLLEMREHSLDHGKTWLPCGVLEEASK